MCRAAGSILRATVTPPGVHTDSCTAAFHDPNQESRKMSGQRTFSASFLKTLRPLGQVIWVREKNSKWLWCRLNRHLPSRSKGLFIHLFLKPLLHDCGNCSADFTSRWELPPERYCDSCHHRPCGVQGSGRYTVVGYSCAPSVLHISVLARTCRTLLGLCSYTACIAQTVLYYVTVVYLTMHLMCGSNTIVLLIINQYLVLCWSCRSCMYTLHR